MNHISKFKRALAALVVVLAVPAGAAVVASPANADTAGLPYGGTATLTIPDVTLAPGGGCINHYGTFSITHVDYWNVDITANGPTTWPAGDYLYGTGPASRVVDLLLCPSIDGPGTYTASGLVTVEDPYSYDQLNAFVSDTFVISHPAPPVPPPPPPVVVTPVDVTGNHALLKKTKKVVKVAFAANNLGANQSQRTRLTYSIKAGSRTAATVVLNAGQTLVKTVKVPKNKKTTFKIIKNGVTVQTFKVKGASLR